MPHAVKNQCDHLVEVYGPAIVEILSRDIDPKDVCTLMQLCNSQETGTAHCSKVIWRGGQNFPTNLEQKHYNFQ